MNEIARLEAEWIELVRKSNAAYFAAKDETGYREAMALMKESRKAREALTRARKENDFSSLACHLCGAATDAPGCPLCRGCAEEQEQDARAEKGEVQ